MSVVRIAFAVHCWIGVVVLRKAGSSVDLIWTETLAFADAITAGFGLWSIAG